MMGRNYTHLFTLFALLTLLNLFASRLFAAPFPGMGSSILVSPEIGAFLTIRGYSLSTQGTDWVPTSRDESTIIDESNLQALRFRLSSHSSSLSVSEKESATLGLSLDEMATPLRLDQYAKRWIREYGQFGFEILGSQSLLLGGQESLVLDLFHKVKNQQLRQVLIKNQKKVAVFTCRDQKENFSTTLPICNRVIKSFRWTATIPQASTL